MYLIAIAWIYVVLMMAVAEATSPQGSLLGAVMTLLLYGVLPLSVLMYILGTPARKRALRQREVAAQQMEAQHIEVQQTEAQEQMAPQTATPTSAGGPLQQAPAAAVPSIPTNSAPPDRRDHAAGEAIAPKGEEA